jgi:hypothetical protein
MQTKRLFITLSLGLGLTLALCLLLALSAAPPTARAWPILPTPTGGSRPLGPAFVKPGGSGPWCLQSDPCGSIQYAVDQCTPGNGDTIYVAGGIYTGTGSAVITVTKSITLYGGWDGTGSGAVVRDPALYPTTLDGEMARRVVYISGNITPTLDGFIVTRGNATGLSGSGGCGGGVFVLNAHPLIVNDTITNNVAAISTGTIGYGGGLYLLNANRAVISGSLIISNAGSTAYEGFGGGMYLWGSGSGMQVQFNRVLSNAATITNTVGDGGGIYGGPDDALIQGNVVAGNRTNSAGVGRAAGLYQYGGSAHYLGNQVRGNSGSSAVELWYSQARLEDNRVVDNATTEGVCLVERLGGGPTLVNNVVARSGSKALSVYGYDASRVLTATLLHNTLVGAGSGYGVYAQYAALYLTNTIVASTTWGITNTTPASSTVLADHTLFWANTNDGIQGTNPVSGNPRFVDPASGDYHLGAGSAAIDAGVDAGVTTDIDGDPRPIGSLPDIGADEYVVCVYLPLVLRLYVAP